MHCMAPMAPGISITFTRKSQNDEAGRVSELVCRREKKREKGVWEGFCPDHTHASPEEMSGGEGQDPTRGGTIPHGVVFPGRLFLNCTTEKKCCVLFLRLIFSQSGAF